jgi:hypothetical protein
MGVNKIGVVAWIKSCLVVLKSASGLSGAIGSCPSFRHGMILLA